jgi:CheY-like chemotaxis protein
MPKIDGIEMVKKIRKLNKDVKIIAVSMMADAVQHRENVESRSLCNE